MVKLSRRSFMHAAGAALLTSLLPRSATGISSLNRPKHTFVLITLQGGVDHAQFLPVFDSAGGLSSHIHFPTTELFEAHGMRFLNVPKVLTPNSPLISTFGHRLALLSGMQMDGQNAHNAALAVLMRGSTENSALSFAAVLGELTGHGTKYGVVSFGVQPFRNSVGLSEMGTGTTLPQKLSALSEQLRLPDSIADMSGEEYIDALTSYTRKYANSSDLNHLIRNPPPGTDLHTFRTVLRDPSAAERKTFINQLNLSADYWAPYEGLSGPYGTDRHEQLAMAAKLINEGQLASCYVINIGKTEGFHSYDTHNAYSGNNDQRQQEKLDRDLRAIEIFLRQIEQHLDNTSVLIGSEFGRPPQLNPTGGRDHWGANNCILALSPFIRTGLHGSVDPETYVGNSIALTDGSTDAFRCRSVYRGILDAIFSNGLVNCSTEMANKIQRQFLPGPLPVGVFNHV
ncbi:MAG: hypothetical protein RI953_873 [Pseudomonadota bacterium]|jgi:hypothetical protein